MCESASIAVEAKLSAFGEEEGKETGTKANLLDKRFSCKSDASVVIAFVLVRALFIKLFFFNNSLHVVINW